MRTSLFSCPVIFPFSLLTLLILPLRYVNAQVTVDGTASWNAVDSTLTGTFDASGSDKLVVVLTGEHGFNNDSGTVNSVTYDGAPLTPVIQRDAREGGTDTIYHHIWILDNPATSAGEIVANVVNRGNVTVFGLSGTEPGVGATVVTPTDTRSAELSTTSRDSLVIASFGMGGAGNGANVNNVTADSPLTFVSAQENGSNWDGHVTGYAQVPFPGTGAYSFSGGTLDGSLVIAAEFTSPSTDIPPNPVPAFGNVVPGGDVELSWTNLAPESGTDVWVDVWFGTDPENLAKVVDAAADGPNRSSATVNAPDAGTYHWRVDSYVDGAPSGTPVTGTAFFFVVEDGDNDGIPDDWEEQFFGGLVAASADPDQDGLSNLEEYQLGSIPNQPDSDGDGLLDGGSITLASSEPRFGDWAALGIVFTDSGGQRTFVGESDAGTDLLEPDTDGDGLADGAEIMAGTDPLESDSDRDGLPDGVETNTGTFVDATDTGTDPKLADSDGDGAGDWYEVFASFTDPTVPSDSPGIPYPLPDPVDSDTGSSGKPVKVYILSGQSNMVGYGRVDGDVPFTLETISKQEGKFPNLVDDATGDWAERRDVRYRGVISALGDGPLAPGFGNNPNSFGPELGFGHVMGWYHDEPVLIIKSSQGGRSLGFDFLPPGSSAYSVGGTTFAGYGDSPDSWPEGTTPTPGDFYGGHHFDKAFLDETDWAPPTGTPFGPVTNVTDILDNFATEYPDWAEQGFEIAGFGWFHGWNDGLSFTSQFANRYEQNMAQFIREIRRYYENRYPGNISPDAPFAIATAAFDGFNSSFPTRIAVTDAQLAVDGDAGNYPEFEGNVKTMEARGYWRTTGPNANQGFHYFHNAETFMLTGDALGRGMVGLLEESNAGYAGWAGGSFLNPLADPDPALDFDGGGLATALEWVLGGDPTDSRDDPGVMPTFRNSGDPDGKFHFVFQRRDAAAADPGTSIVVEYATDLISWTPTTHQGEGPDEITITEAPGDPGFTEITVALPVNLAADRALFARLKVSVAVP